MTLTYRTKGSPRPRVGVKPPPGGAVGGCPAQGRAGYKNLVRSVPGLTRDLSVGHEAPGQARGGYRQ